MDRVRVIVDTDIGDDVDDAIALALALESPELEVVGVTTVYKNVHLRTQLARTLLDIYEADIPVATGIGQPFRYQVDDTSVPHQCRTLTKTYEPNCDLDAVSFIIDALRKDPGIVIIAIGPLTNIGMAVKLAPEILRQARIVIMGGAFTAVYPEYNILCDPEAANCVIHSGAQVEMIGLDVTTACVLSAADVQRILLGSSKRGRFLAELTSIWMDTSIAKKVTLHDPLTVAYVVDPTMLEMESEPINIELEGTFTRGLTALCRTPFRKRGEYPDSVVNVAREVSFPALRSLLFERVFVG